MFFKLLATSDFQSVFTNLKTKRDRIYCGILLSGILLSFLQLMSSNDVNWISTKAVKVSRSQHVETASQKPTKCCSRRNWILLLKLLKCASTFCLLLPLSKCRPSKINYSCSNYVVIMHVAVSFSDCALYFCSKVISNVCMLFYSRDFFYKVAVVKYIIFVWILMQFFFLSCLFIFCLVYVSCPVCLLSFVLSLSLIFCFILKMLCNRQMRWCMSPLFFDSGNLSLQPFN